jgi:type I restriction enzyme S subunit
MKGYDNYKSTKIVWYPEIPKHWNYCKVKHLANTFAGGTPSTVVNSYWEGGEIPWLPSGKLQNCEIVSAEKFITEDGLNNSSTKWIKPNTVLIALTGATCANIGYLKFNACANQSVVAIDETTNKANSRFLYYMFLSMRSQILTHQTGGAQAGINDGDVKNLYLLQPSIEEQTTIASFLDYKTSLIDATIEKKKRLMELLKEKRQAVINEAVTKGLNANAPMKDSGIPSFGRIPKNWKVTKLKFISNVKGRIGFRGYTVNDLVDEGFGALVLGASHITWEGEIDLSNPVFISWEKYEESPEIKLDKGDIIIVQRGSTCGKVAIISNEIEKATINPSLVVLKNIDANSFYVFSSIKAALGELVNLTRSSAIPMLSQEQIGNLQIVLPPIQEQKEIDDYLNQIKKDYNSLINQCSISIDNLNTYRQSLISEAVTGKIDVRDWVPNKQ